MKKIAFLLLFAFSCTDEESTRNTLLDQGYTEVKIHGYDAFACGDNDTTCTSFTAVSPAGRQVKGVVGCGVGCGKSCTIRFNR